MSPVLTHTEKLSHPRARSHAMLCIIAMALNSSASDMCNSYEYASGNEAGPSKRTKLACQVACNDLFVSIILISQGFSGCEVGRPVEVGRGMYGVG